MVQKRRHPFDLTGRQALVTGAYQGLGWGMAEGLARAGASVLLVDVNPLVVQKAHQLCQQGMLAEGVCADLLDRNERGKMKRIIEERLSGELDILVNNAGIQIRHPVVDFPMEDWDTVIELNLNAVFDLAQWAARLMIPRRRGKIINIAS